MEQNQTLCVILHYGEENDTWNCVSTIIDKKCLDIIIVDNDPVQKIKIPDCYKKEVRIFRAGGSYGFAKANNIAVRECRQVSNDSVLLLNNDTIVLEDAIDRLRGLLEIKNIGGVGPCMPFLNYPDKIWACGGRIRKLNVSISGLKESIRSEPYDVDYLPGAAILCKLNVWDRVGGLPEKYFLGYEEAEFAMRIRQLNLRIVVDPMAKILHRVGMSSDFCNTYIYNWIRNRLKFGCYLWGKPIGFNLAALMVLIEMRKRNFAPIIWLRAIMDEMRNVPLDFKTIQKIRRDFGE